MDIAKIRKKLKDTKSSDSEQSVQMQTQEDLGEVQKNIPDESGETILGQTKDDSTGHLQGINGQRFTESKTSDIKSDELSTKRVSPEPDINKDHELIEKEEVITDKGEGSGKKPKAEDSEDRNDSKKTDELIEILTFNLLKEEFAFRISDLDEIRKYQVITLVPKMPNYVLGVTSLRGKVIPVIDLKLKLFLAEKSLGSNHMKKVLIIRGPKGPIGAVVDKIIGVIRIAKNEILPPPSHLTESEQKFIEGIAVIDKRFISIIRMEEAVSIQ